MRCCEASRNFHYNGICKLINSNDRFIKGSYMPFCAHLTQAFHALYTLQSADEAKAGAFDKCSLNTIWQSLSQKLSKSSEWNRIELNKSIYYLFKLILRFSLLLMYSTFSFCLVFYMMKWLLAHSGVFSWFFW